MPPYRDDENPGPGRRYALIGTLAAIAVFSLWMRAGFLPFAIEGAIYDDGLFLKLARSLLAGHWLGKFDDRTLVKGAFYPVFIDAAYWLRIPLKVAEQAAYVGASFLLASVLIAGRAGSRKMPVLGVAVFAALCLNPVVWTVELSRVIREGAYLGLSLGVVGLTAMASFPPNGAGARRSVGAGVGLGLTLGAFWLTREEGLWLVPAMATVAAIGLGSRIAMTGWRMPWLIVTSSVAAAAAFGAVIGGVSAMNLAHYGVFETNEVKSAAFGHAYGALARIKPELWQRYIVFPKDARAKAYAASPLARELEPVFDGPPGLAVARVRCEEYAILPCIGVHAGWFQWVLRAAVTQAGHYRSEPDAQAYYAGLAREIDAACADGRLDCLPPRATLAPPFRREYLGDTWREAGAVFATLFGVRGGGLYPHPSEGSQAGIDVVADMVGPVNPTTARRVVIRGWAAARGAAPVIQVRARESVSVDAAVDVQPAPDLAPDLAPEPGAGAGVRAVRFVVSTDCLAACDLTLGRPGVPDSVIAIEGLVPGRAAMAGTAALFIDSSGEQARYPETAGMRTLQLRIAEALASVYSVAYRVIWPFAAAGLALAILYRRRAGAPAIVYALALGSGVAVLCRVLLLSYLEVTSIPSNNMLYLSPATPFLIMFLVLGLYLGGLTWVRRRRPVAAY